MTTAILNENRAPNDPGHVTDHDLVAAILNRLLATSAAAPAAGATFVPDVGVASGWNVALPAGNITVGAVAATGGFGPYPQQRLTLTFTQDAAGGRTVTWDGSFLNPPVIAAGAGAVTVTEWVNVGTQAGVANASWRQVNALTGALPAGPAGGSLAGTYPNPSLAASSVTDTTVAAGAAIAESKLALASDAVAATPSRRSLGTGAQQAMPGNAAVASQILAYTRYFPGGLAITGVVTQPWAAIDTTNLAITFVAPSSGRVWMTYRGLAKIDTPAGGNISFGFRNASANVTDSTGATPYTQVFFPTANQYALVLGHLLYDGLTPGNSYTWYLAWAAGTGQTPSFACGVTAGGPAYITVQAVP